MATKTCPRGTKKVGKKCTIKNPSNIKIRTKNFWKTKNVDLSLSRPDVEGRRIVAIGEEIEPNTYKFIHLDVDTFLNFAKEVRKKR